jgi:PTH2 family peptidyl-tRNA hydrolase
VKLAGIKHHVVTDSGLTEFGGVPTKTCVAIGPDKSSKIDIITGGLELL